MTSRTHARLAWSLWALAMVVGAVSLALRLWNGSAVTSTLEGAEYLSEILWWDVLLPASIPAYATVGAVVASRRPGNAVGWLCLALGALVAVEEATWEYAARTYEVAPGTLPAGVLVSWFSAVAFPLIPLTFVLMLLLFPGGRLPSRRWRVVAWAAAGGAGLWVFSIAVGPEVSAGLVTDLANPTGIEGLEAAAGVAQNLAFLALPTTLLGSVASVFLRWRGAGGAERQQLKWLAYTGAVIAASMLGGLASGATSGAPYATVLVIGVAVAGVTIGIPLSMGVAILRHHLYDIDRIVNRTLVYGALTVTLVLVYLGGVVVLQYLFRVLTGQESQLAVVASTLAIAALFVPLRNRMQGLVDRRFYRKKYDAARTLAAFSARLRDETDLDALNGELVSVVKETIQPAYVSLWLRKPDGER